MFFFIFGSLKVLNRPFLLEVVRVSDFCDGSLWFFGYRS